MSVSPDNYGNASRNDFPTDPRYKGGLLSSCRANLDGVRLPDHPKVADLDIVTSRGQTSTGSIAQCDVVVTSGVVEERINTVGRVVAAGAVVKERVETLGRIVVAGAVAVDGAAAVLSHEHGRVSGDRLFLIGLAWEALTFTFSATTGPGTFPQPFGLRAGATLRI